MRTKILTLVGVRPNYTRLASLIRRFDLDTNNSIEHVLVHTGQHYSTELYSNFLHSLGLRKPDFDLGVGHLLREMGVTDPRAQIPVLLDKFLGILQKIQPDIVVMTGDTNTVLASIIASRFPTALVHIEAGLRSYDWRMPEEKNRIIIDHLADALYCYLECHRKILHSEGIDERRITVVGNVIIDTLYDHMSSIDASSIMRRLGLAHKKFFLCTIHRVENTNQKDTLEWKLRNILEYASRYNIPVVAPFMPRTVQVMERFGLHDILSDPLLIVTEPLGFFDFARLEKDARLIISDSGTVQEEAFILGTPLVIARRSSERPEVIQTGAAILEGMEGARTLHDAIERGMRLSKSWDQEALNPQGGSPSDRIHQDIIEKIQNNFFKKSRTLDYNSQNVFVRQAFALDV